MSTAPDPGSSDHYKVLGVRWDASTQDITKTYRQLARYHHPDKNLGDADGAKEIFQAIVAAFEVLSDENKRRAYDQQWYDPRLWSAAQRGGCSAGAVAPQGAGRGGAGYKTGSGHQQSSRAAGAAAPKGAGRGRAGYKTGTGQEQASNPQRWSSAQQCGCGAGVVARGGAGYKTGNGQGAAVIAKDEACSLGSSSAGLSHTPGSTGAGCDGRPRQTASPAEGADAGQLPKDQEMLRALREAGRPLTVREVYLLGLRRDPKKEMMGTGVKKLVNQRLYAMQKEGAVAGRDGQWWLP